MRTSRKRKYTINSIVRALRILVMLGEQGEAMRISEISRRLALDKSTAYRIVSTLREEGFVDQEPETHKYLLGVKVIEVAGLKLRSIRLLPTAKPVMKDLMRRTQEAVHLAILVEGESMYLDCEQSSGVFNINHQVGGRAPVHSSAVGKALLAELPKDEVKRVTALKGLTRFTDRTIISLQELHRDLTRTRERGWALDDEETTVGVRCVAAAIHDHLGTVVASVGLSSPTQRMSSERIETLGQLVKDAAAAISMQLGYASPAPSSETDAIRSNHALVFP